MNLHILFLIIFSETIIFLIHFIQSMLFFLLMLSGSTDHSVRLWTLGGRYISTFGTFKPWLPILPTIPTYQYFKDYKYPADIKRVASSTTLKVINFSYNKLFIRLGRKFDY